ncbi:MAG TPA: hypothetical protein VNJ09_01895, partial [Chthonomonadales bacterium]|nr:hypothetical protein [Chthonomonadales bacterium]
RVSVSDIFLGRNTVGPYMLSWKGVEPRSEAVYRAAQRLTPEVDYRLDPATGTLVFTNPLTARDIVRVDYRYIPGKAVPNNAQAILPLQFNLLGGSNGALTLDAVYRPAYARPIGAKTEPDSGLMLLGLSGNTQWTSGSTLTGKLYLDSRGGDLSRRGAIQLVEESKTPFGQFNVGFTHSGAGFQAGKELGLPVGREVLEAAGTLNPIYGVQASVSFTRATELPEKGQGAVVTTLRQRLAGPIGASTRFQLTRTEITTDTPEQTGSTRIVDRAQIDQKIDAHTQATAIVERTETEIGNEGKVTQTNPLSIRSQPIEQITLSGSFQNRLQPNGVEDTQTIRIEATPSERVKLSALLGERYNRQNALHRREASIEYIPSKGFTLSSSVLYQSEGSRELLSQGVYASAQPGKFLEVTGGVRLRNETGSGVSEPGAPDSYDVRIGVGLPNRTLWLTGGLVQNPENDKGLVMHARSRSIGLQSNWGQFSLKGSYALQDEYLEARSRTILDVTFVWRPTRMTQIITGFREDETQDSGLFSTETYSLSLSHRIGSVFDFILTGSMTTRTKDRMLHPDPDYKAEAKLGIRF